MSVRDKFQELADKIKSVVESFLASNPSYPWNCEKQRADAFDKCLAAYAAYEWRDTKEEGERAMINFVAQCAGLKVDDSNTEAGYMRRMCRVVVPPVALWSFVDWQKVADDAKKRVSVLEKEADESRTKMRSIIAINDNREAENKALKDELAKAKAAFKASVQRDGEHLAQLDQSREVIKSYKARIFDLEQRVMPELKSQVTETAKSFDKATRDFDDMCRRRDECLGRAINAEIEVKRLSAVAASQQAELHDLYYGVSDMVPRTVMMSRIEAEIREVVASRETIAKERDELKQRVADLVAAKDRGPMMAVHFTLQSAMEDALSKVAVAEKQVNDMRTARDAALQAHAELECLYRGMCKRVGELSDKIADAKSVLTK